MCGELGGRRNNKKKTTSRSGKEASRHKQIKQRSTQTKDRQIKQRHAQKNNKRTNAGTK